MARTTFATNDNLAVKLFSKKLAIETIRATYIGRFIGEDENSLIQRFVDLEREAGDKITYGLMMALDGEGKQGDSTLEGEEENINFHDDALLVDQLRHATRDGGRMTRQRTPYLIRSRYELALRQWLAQRLDTWFFNQICGNNAQSNTIYTGNNSVSAPDSDHHVWAGSNSDDQSLSSGDTMTFAVLDKALESATVTPDGTPFVRPLMIGGEPYYVVFMHDFQARALRQDTSTNEWADIQKAAMQGGRIADNPIFTGALGIYNGMILHKASRVTDGVHSSNATAETDVKRAVLCGAQAAAVAWAGGTTPDRFEWVEDRFDYNNQIGVSAGIIGGLKATRFNSKDFGKVVISTAAAAAA